MARTYVAATRRRMVQIDPPGRPQPRQHRLIRMSPRVQPVPRLPHPVQGSRIRVLPGRSEAVVFGQKPAAHAGPPPGRRVVTLIPDRPMPPTHPSRRRIGRDRSTASKSSRLGLVIHRSRYQAHSTGFSTSVTLRPMHFMFHCIDGRRLCLDARGPQGHVRGDQGLDSAAGLRRSPKSDQLFLDFLQIFMDFLVQLLFPFFDLACDARHVLDRWG